MLMIMLLDKMEETENKERKCLTGCAHTYKEAREEQKKREKERIENCANEIQKERKPKSFSLAKLGPVAPDPLEGIFRQIQSQNFDAYLKKIGAGPNSISMVMRAAVILKINQVFLEY